MAATAHITDDRLARGILTAALVLVASATGAAFGRLFVGSESAGLLAIAAAAATLVGAVLERRHLLISLVAAVAGCLVALGLLLFRETTFLGLPTPATLRAIGDALGLVGRHAAVEFTPAAPLPSLLTASLIAVWCAAYASHALAVRAASPVLALLPPAGLLAFASVLAEDGARLGYDAVFLVGALGVLYGSGLRRLERWGPLLARKARAMLIVPGRQARWLGAAALGTAIFLPGILPGLGGEAAVDLQNGENQARLGVSPIVDLRPSLLSDPQIELFTVRSRRPAYWRLASLERFDGRIWSSGDLYAKNGLEIRGTSGLPGARRAANSSFLVQDFELTGLRAEWLPGAYRATSVSLGDAVARFDEDHGTIVPSSDLSEGFRYRVTSELVVPSPTQLQRVQDVGNDEALGFVTRLPPSVPPRVHEIAREITRGVEGPYAKMLALQQHLRAFTYDQQAPAGHGIEDILFFLDESKRGYCEQFAGAMAVLARSLGYASRVAIGFTPGERLPDGRFQVTTGNTHAWTEIFFRPFGWLAFEPTPTRTNPVATDYVSPAAAIVDPDTVTPPEFSSLTPQEMNSYASQRESVEADDILPEARVPAAPPTGPPPRSVPFWILPLAALLIACGVAATRLGKRRLRLARADGNRERVVAAYRVFEGAAADVGLGREAGETPDEFALRLRAGVRFSNGDLERLTDLARSALYAPGGVTREHGRHATAAARTLTSDVRRHAGRVRTVIGALGLRERLRISPPPGPGGSPDATPSRTGRGRSGTR